MKKALRCALYICYLISRPIFSLEPIATPISIAELIDKITILRIKQLNVADPEKLTNITRELSLLEEMYTATIKIPDEVLSGLADQLYSINNHIWYLEDAIRIHERNNLFDQRFIDIARAIYHSNDQRTRIKRLINEHCESVLIEEKSYPLPEIDNLVTP